MFREKCCSCHNPDKKTGGLDLTSFGQTMAGGSSGEVIAPGDPDGSYLMMLVTPRVGAEDAAGVRQALRRLARQ